MFFLNASRLYHVDFSKKENRISGGSELFLDLEGKIKDKIIVLHCRVPYFIVIGLPIVLKIFILMYDMIVPRGVRAKTYG